ncbi:hypothetical protein F4775DRAFT_594920 [Biscogniauxia sp. FL1348]|nr:hypothetical protein F4775DRAFT_594920 [Biscogniauxia sp. FL1348]
MAHFIGEPEGNMSSEASNGPLGHVSSEYPVNLLYLPTEMIMKIMEQMTPKDVSNFALANKRLFSIFKGSEVSMMIIILQNMPELEPMLYLYTATKMEMKPGYMLHPRTIVFNPECEGGKRVYLIRANVAFSEGRLICPEKITFNFDNILDLWKLTKVVDWWTEAYPSLRWRDHPEDRRCLRTGEEARLRKAIARWWLYACYFHGAFWRDIQAPKKWQEDKRLHHIRILSTQEICELEDLWGVMYDAISKDLCSSPERVRDGSWSGVELVPWGEDERRHSNIVNTYLKLDPQVLQFFLVHYPLRRKADMIKAVSGSQRDFTLDRETLSLSITTVLQERMMLKPHGINNVPRIGIIDEDRVSKEECEPWSNDASPTGKPPLTQQQINAFPFEPTKRVARGDDGTELSHPY